jgi:mono/diheme cytochrome c family protein
MLALMATGCQAQPSAVPGSGTRQGWTSTDPGVWYTASQGSRLIPLEWLLAMERPDAPGKFLDDAHVTQLRFLPQRDGNGAPTLPVGFAVDAQTDAAFTRTRLRWRAGQGGRLPDDQAGWVGLNCSACHTAEITWQGSTIRVDGGPALSDFQALMEALLLAERRTLDEPDRWARFAGAVLVGPAATEPAQRQLRSAMETHAAWLANHQRMNDTGGLRYGFGRLDAFGHIFNQVANLADPALATGNTPDAPVSYPHIWNIHRLRHVQYNAIAANQPFTLGGSVLDVGALGRNIGEVIGVFADVVVPPQPASNGLTSSVDVESLVGLEQLLARLEPPRWPALFDPPNRDAASRSAVLARGRELFARDCASCHQPMTPGPAPIDTQLSTFNDASNPRPPGAPPNVAPGTDIWMACNAYTYRAQTGRLRGVPVTYTAILDNVRLGDDAPVATMLKTMVGGALIGRGSQVVGTAFRTFLFGDRPPRVYPAPALPAGPAFLPNLRQLRQRECETAVDALLGYKARPLDGIWATGPFLHNGSVPNLYEVLLEPSRRTPRFRIGTREFDPVRVGYRIDAEAPGNTQWFETRDAAGNAIPGNSNLGHDYGNGNRSEADQQALLDYLKTL